MLQKKIKSDTKLKFYQLDESTIVFKNGFKIRLLMWNDIAGAGNTQNV